jgi:hypothetical protein
MEASRIMDDSRGGLMDAGRTAAALLGSSEPSIRWRTRVEVLGEDPERRTLRSLREEIRRSPRVKALLAEGRVPHRNLYHKWRGGHWVLVHLADLAYPPSDPTLRPLAESVLDYWLRPTFYHEFDVRTRSSSYGRQGVPRIDGRFRRCASQQGNALRAALLLGFDGERCERLAERLMHWQWPDGGWNCDREPSADTSSFGETLVAMVALAHYGMLRRDRAAVAAARAASEVFLRRGLFRRVSDGRVIHPEFLKLHYPRYWHYDLLGGLRGMHAVERLSDPRSREALEQLEGKRSPSGWWSAEGRYYRRNATGTGPTVESVEWDGGRRAAGNEWITLESLGVLAAAGRVDR